jgi:hypothetical protein
MLVLRKLVFFRFEMFNTNPHVRLVPAAEAAVPPAMAVMIHQYLSSGPAMQKQTRAVFLSKQLLTVIAEGKRERKITDLIFFFFGCCFFLFAWEVK